MSVAFVCDRCERPIHAPMKRPPGAIECHACGAAHPLRVGEEVLRSGRVTDCLRCGGDRLYTQKDFNRKVGLAVFAAAALLSVPTWGLSLLAATIVDLALYAVLGEVTICYVCNTQHRGFRRNPAHGSFDLHVAETVDRRPRPV